MNSPGAKGLTLYELGAEWLALEAALLASAGDLTPDVEAAFAALGELESHKVDAYCALIRSFTAWAEMVKLEEAVLTAKRRTAENAATRLKERLKQYLDLRGLSQLKGITWTAALQRNPAAVHVLVAPELLPAEYQRVTVEANKRALEADLKAPEGHPEVFQYAEFAEPSYSLRIR